MSDRDIIEGETLPLIERVVVRSQALAFAYDPQRTYACWLLAGLVRELARRDEVPKAARKELLAIAPRLDACENGARAEAWELVHGLREAIERARKERDEKARADYERLQRAKKDQAEDIAATVRKLRKLGDEQAAKAREAAAAAFARLDRDRFHGI